MCNECICKNIKEGSYNEKKIAQGDWVTMYIGKEDGEHYLRTYGEGQVTYKINYCLKCGRKL